MSLRSNNSIFRFVLFLLSFLIPCSSFSQWVSQNSNTSQTLHSIHFVNTQTGYAAGNGGVVIRTTSGGNNWSILSTGTSTQLNSVYVFNSNTAIVCGNSGLIIKTTNGGANWAAITSGVNATLYGIAFSNDSNGVCGGNGTLLWSSSGGATWSIAQTGYLVTYYGMQMFNSTLGFAGGVNSIFSPLIGKTTNGGANWAFYSFYVQSNEATLRDIHFINSNEGFAVSIVFNGQGGISYTTNGGANWSSQIFTYGLLGVDFPSPNIGYSVGTQGYILKTTDRGLTWNQQSANTSSILWDVSFPDSLTGYIAGDNGLIFKTTNGGITPVKPISNRVPSGYSLYQNYPNPFNPSTYIRFDIPSSVRTPAAGDNMSLRVFDPVGHEVAILVNQILPPGSYEINWDASNVPAGIYFYSLQAKGFSETKKLVLLK